MMFYIVMDRVFSRKKKFKLPDFNFFFVKSNFRVYGISQKMDLRQVWTRLFFIFCQFFLAYFMIFLMVLLKTLVKNEDKCLVQLAELSKPRFRVLSRSLTSFYNKCNLITRKSFFYDLARHQIYVKMHGKKLLIFVWWCSRIL